MKNIKTFLSLIRVSNWPKSLFVFIGIIYDDTLSHWQSSCLAALAFSITSSAVYIFNDIKDILEDRSHPHKRNRPIAKGDISIQNASVIMIILLILGLSIALTVSTSLLWILFAYVVINLAYNLLFKHIVIMDVSCIAFGFMLRVLAGTIGIGLPISFWLTSIITILSFFIALSKRRMEIALNLANPTRKVLKKYKLSTLNTLMLFSAVMSFLLYVFYVFYARQHSFYLVLTLPFAAFSLWRFTKLVTRPQKRDDPVIVFLSDATSCMNLSIFILLTLFAVHFPN